MAFRSKDVQKMDVHFLDMVKGIPGAKGGVTKIRLTRWKLSLPFRGRLVGEQVTVEMQTKTMRGTDLRGWRERMGYTQEALMHELGVRSRQTIISWEQSTEALPRMTQLALHALEHQPELRNVAGERAAAWTRRRLEQRYGT
jgi:DNA-binding XRE family transcriptional regulator